MVFAFFQSGNSLVLLLLCGIIIIVKSSKFKGSFDIDGGEALFANPITFLGQMLSSAPLVSKEVIDERECLLECAKDSQCRSTNFQTVAVSSGKFICQILDTNKFLSPELISRSMDYRHHSFSVSKMICQVYFLFMNILRVRFFGRIQKRICAVSDHADSSLLKKQKIRKRIIYHDNGMSSCSSWDKKKKQHKLRMNIRNVYISVRNINVSRMGYTPQDSKIIRILN